MLPVTFFNVNKSQLGGATSLGFRPTVYSKVGIGYRQKKPYNLNLPYQMDIQTVTGFSSSDPASYCAVGGHPEVSGRWVGTADAKAYDRFKGRAYEQASLAITIAERKQTMNMIALRGLSMARGLQQLTRGNVTGAMKAFGYTGSVPRTLRSSPTRRRARSAGNLFLEYHFGWSPLVGDIYSAAKVLQSPFPYMDLVKGSAKDSKSVFSVVMDTNTPTNRTYWTQGRSVTYTRRYGANVVVVNPNLHTLDALGLANPALVAWELVPFSFVVDWFTGIGSWLTSFSDFLGLELRDSWSVSHWRGTEWSSYSGTNFWIDVNTGVRNAEHSHTTWSRSHTALLRGTSAPTRPLAVSLPDRLSPSRAATAISLLLQRLK